MNDAHLASRERKLVPDTPGWEAMCHLVQAQRALVLDDSLPSPQRATIHLRLNQSIRFLSECLLAHITDDMFPTDEELDAGDTGAAS